MKAADIAPTRSGDGRFYANLRGFFLVIGHSIRITRSFALYLPVTTVLHASVVVFFFSYVFLDIVHWGTLVLSHVTEILLYVVVAAAREPCANFEPWNFRHIITLITSLTFLCPSSDLTSFLHLVQVGGWFFFSAALYQ